MTRNKKPIRPDYMSTNNIEVIKKFYANLMKEFSNFETLDEEKLAELDESIKIQIFNLNLRDHYNFLTKLYVIARNLLTSADNLALNTGDEKAYFYIKTLDPQLKMLEVAKTANSKEEIKNITKMYYGLYDPYLIKLEMSYVKRLQELNKNENVSIEKGRIH